MSEGHEEHEVRTQDLRLRRVEVSVTEQRAKLDAMATGLDNLKSGVDRLFEVINRQGRPNYPTWIGLGSLILMTGMAYTNITMGPNSERLEKLERHEELFYERELDREREAGRMEAELTALKDFYTQKLSEE